MKIVLRLTEKPKGKSFKFLKLTVHGIHGENVFLEFSKDEFNHFNTLSSFDEERNIIIIDNVTITAGDVLGTKIYRYGQSLESLSKKDMDIIYQALTSETSVLTVLEEDWLDLGAEFVELY